MMLTSVSSAERWKQQTNGNLNPRDSSKSTKSYNHGRIVLFSSLKWTAAVVLTVTVMTSSKHIALQSLSTSLPSFVMTADAYLVNHPHPHHRKRPAIVSYPNPNYYHNKHDNIPSSSSSSLSYSSGSTPTSSSSSSKTTSSKTVPTTDSNDNDSRIEPCVVEESVANLAKNMTSTSVAVAASTETTTTTATTTTTDGEEGREDTTTTTAESLFSPHPPLVEPPVSATTPTKAATSYSYFASEVIPSSKTENGAVATTTSDDEKKNDNDNLDTVVLDEDQEDSLQLVGDSEIVDSESPTVDIPEEQEEENDTSTLSNVISSYFAVIDDDDDDYDNQELNDPMMMMSGSKSDVNSIDDSDMEEMDILDKVYDDDDDDMEWSLLSNSNDDGSNDDDDDDIVASFSIDEAMEAETFLRNEQKKRMQQKVAKELKQPDPIRDFTNTLRDVAVDGSFALLRGLRYTAAAALTSTLPKTERAELMERVVPSAAAKIAAVGQMDDTSSASSDGSIWSTTNDMDDFMSEDDYRGSVQEEIALAVREEARRNEALWQEERDVITAQLEEAANARVQAELKIQQQRLDDEKEMWQQTELQAMRADLKEQITYLQDQLRQAEDARQHVVDQNVSVAVQEAKTEMVEQEARKLEDLQRLLKKRREQEAKLDAVEESLRRRAAEIKAEKEHVERMERQQTLSSALSSFGNISPGVISSVPAHLAARKDKQNLQYPTKQQQEVSSPADVPASDAEIVDEHPILGPVVADLGYKKVYLTSSGKLGTIPIWSKQRTYRNDRARRMAVDKARTMHLGVPGVICLFEDIDGSLSILDGQHRIGMMQVLRQQRNKRMEQQTSGDDTGDSDVSFDTFFDNVLVEVYCAANAGQNTTKLSVDPEQVFLEINKAEPVHLVDMPGIASVDDRKAITEAVETLKVQFPKMFSSSQKCRVPNVNVDNLRNSIFGANCLKRIKKTNSEQSMSDQLLEWLLVQNARVGEKYESYYAKKGKPMFVSPKAWKKASQNGFYLGLESSWLYQKDAP